MSLYGILPPVSTTTTTSSSSSSSSPPPPPSSSSSSLQPTTTTTTASSSSLPPGWSSSLSLLQPQPIRRQQPSRKPQRPITTITTTTTTTTNTNTHKTSSNATTTNSTTSTTTSNLPLKLPFTPVKPIHRQQHEKKRSGKGHWQRDVLSMTEEYDPARPNDYEEYKEARKRRKEEEAVTAQLQHQHQLQRNHSRKDNFKSTVQRSPPSRYDSREHSSPYRSCSPSPSPVLRGGLGFSSAAIERNPPVPSTPHVNLTAATGEDAYLMRGRLSSAVAAFPVPPPITAPPVRSIPPSQPPANEKPTRVVLLTNMVGPGEVDNTLQEETAEECSKYGKVEKCLIFEVPNGQVPPDQSVRIFVQFANATSAQSAVTDLNGRFFGGRVVTARFFDEGKFARLDLAPVREGR